MVYHNDTVLVRRSPVSSKGVIALPDVFTSAQERGRAREIKTTVRELLAELET